jgi:hypothetical protein
VQLLRPLYRRTNSRRPYPKHLTHHLLLANVSKSCAYIAVSTVPLLRRSNRCILLL